MSFDAVLCDVDGVVRLYDASMADLEKKYGLASGALTPGSEGTVAFDPELLQAVTTGRCTDEEWRSTFAERLGLAARAEQLLEDWPRGRVDEEVLDLLQGVRPDRPVVLVSNGTTRLEDDLAALGVLDKVDAVVNSARIGFAKPDEQIYRFAARRAGVDPKRCLFVDDSARHVEAARSLGMTGLVYTAPVDLRKALAVSEM